MSDKSSRRIYLQIVSRFYEIASEFSADQLRDVYENLVSQRNSSHAAVVKILLDLHGEKVETPAILKGESHSRAEVAHPASERATENSSKRDQMVREFVLGESIFPSAKELARVEPFGIDPKFKESRLRYSGRIWKHYISLSEDQKASSARAFVKSAAGKYPESFVSKWSALIKGL